MLIRITGSDRSTRRCCAARLTGVPRGARAGRVGLGTQAHAAARLIAGAMRQDRRRRLICAPASRSGSIPAGKPIGAIRRFRRAADARFFRLRQCEIGDGAVAGAAAFPDGAGGHSIGYRHVILPLRLSPKDAAKASSIHPEARLCGLREAVRAGRSRTCAFAPATAPTTRLSPPSPRAATRRPSATANVLSIRAVHREPGGRTRARRRRACRPRRRACRSFCRRTDARMVAAAAGAGRERWSDRAIQLRSRRPAGGRAGQGRDPHLHRRVRPTTPSRFRSISTNPPRRANLSAVPPSGRTPNGIPHQEDIPCPSRSAIACPKRNSE